MLTYVIALIVVLLCVGGGLSGALYASFRRRRQDDEVADQREKLLKDCPPAILRLAEYAFRPESQLLLGLQRLRSANDSADCEDEGNEDRVRPDLSWIYYDPNELILIDFLHMRELIRAGSSGTRAQFDLGRQFCAAMKIDFRGDAWSDGRYNTRIEQGFEALSILAADGHPDRLFLRDLFSACAELLASPDSEHLPYALEEIRRAARTQEEITSESVLNDREHKVRWARWMIGHHHRLLNFPWDTGALAVHFSGLRAISRFLMKQAFPQGVLRYEREEMKSHVLQFLMTQDLCHIVTSLAESLDSPTDTQIDLIKGFDRKARISLLSDPSDAAVPKFIWELGHSDLNVLQILANAGHQDRFVVKELYLGFARAASKGCLKRLPFIEEWICSLAIAPDENGTLAEEATFGADVEARQILGVDETASFDDVREAYRRNVQLWHPDRLSGMAPELQALANERLAQLNEAYVSLKSERRAS